MKILGIYLRLQTIIPQTYQLLRQQSYLNGQVHEAFRKLVTRYQSPPKATTLHMLYPPNSSLQLSTMVLQQGPNILPYENPRQMQRRATIWILGAFKTSPSEGIEVIAGIIPMKFYLQKIAKRLQIRPFKLPTNHILRNIMDDSPPSSTITNPHKIGLLTNHQRILTKGHLINSYNKSHGIFPSFSPLSIEFSPGHHIIDNFSDHFLVNRKEKTKNNTHTQELDEMVLQVSSLPHTALMVTDASIKNDCATSISHIHLVNSPLTKTVHHASFVTSTEAELFTIRCSINQACSKDYILKIIIITDSIHTAKKIFDSNSHLYHLHSIVILRELQEFFNSNLDNSIEFWECPSHLKWRFHCDVNKDSKSFHPTPSYPCKILWDFCKKTNSDDIIKQ